MDTSASLCSSCQQQPGDAGTLSCDHAYCHACFGRYIHSTVDELNRSLRCCVCGQTTLLTFECRRETLLQRFGRDVHPKLDHVTGLAMRSNGDYVMADIVRKRIYLFDSNGRHVSDFAYVYKYDVMDGITVDKTGRIIVPTLSFDATNPFNKERHVALAYFNTQGHQRGYTYLEKTADVKSLCTNSKNEVFATDYNNSKVWVVNELQRIGRCINIEAERGELATPRPWGICVDDGDNVYVTDSANHCVKSYDSAGNYRFHFGDRGEQPGQFVKPTGVAVDAQRRIIVVDSHNHRVQIFNDEGVFERFIVRYNKGDDVYLEPTDVMCLPDNRVAVLLRGVKDARRTEVRVYPCDGSPDVLSC